MEAYFLPLEVAAHATQSVWQPQQASSFSSLKILSVFISLSL